MDTTTTKKPTLTGRYSGQGYEILADGEIIYRAGNHPYDSQTYLPPDSEWQLPLGKIREFCLGTLKEFAQERGLPFKARVSRGFVRPEVW